MPRDISLATRVLLAQLVVLLVALVPLGFAAVDHARSAERRRAVDVAEATSLSLASSPWVLEAVAGPDPATELREPVERLRAETGVDFIVVMAPDGTRYTHPDPDQVGGIFIGSRDGALAGGASRSRTRSGRSVRPCASWRRSPTTTASSSRSSRPA